MARLAAVRLAAVRLAAPERTPAVVIATQAGLSASLERCADVGTASGPDIIASNVGTNLRQLR